MAVTLRADIRLVPGKLAQFESTLEILVPIMELQGWFLLGSWTNLSGPNNRVTDLWQLEDLSHLQRSFAGLRNHELYPEIRKSLDECVSEETLTFMTPLLARFK